MTNEWAGIAANIDIKAKAKIGSYADAKAFLHAQGGNFKADLASNVRVERDIGDLSGPIHVVLYETRIVTYYPDETFSVANGGYNTPTTSRRVTQFTPDGYIFGHQDKKLALNGKKGSAENQRFPVKRLK
jgi:hypothetical protein